MLASVMPTVSKPVLDLQRILVAVGVPAVALGPSNALDGIYGQKTGDAWGIVAASLGLDPRFERVDARTARVASAAYDRLLREAVVREAPRPAPGDAYSKLNNAIVRASWASAGFDELSASWQDSVVEERAWKIAIPPLWSSTLDTYYRRYADLYNAAPAATQLRLVPPEYLAPGDSIDAFKDLWRPAIDAAGETYDRAVERVEATLRAAGREVAVGVREESVDWAWGALAGGALIVAVWAALRTVPAAR